MRTMILAAAVLATACGPQQVGAPAPKQGDAPAVSVRTVLTTEALVGQTVVVSGYCIPAARPAKAHGTQPVRRSDWQLEEHGVAVWERPEAGRVQRVADRGAEHDHRGGGAGHDSGVRAGAADQAVSGGTVVGPGSG